MRRIIVPLSSRAILLAALVSAAGVSIGTVSKAVNKSGSLRPKTRERVLATATALGFRPNDLAQALHWGQSYTVRLVSNDSFGRFTMPILEALEDALYRQGIAVFKGNASDDPERARSHVEQLLGKRVDGLVFTARRTDRRPHVGVDLGRLQILFVFACGEDLQAPCLLPGDEGGAHLATVHLLAMGCRRIAHVHWPRPVRGHPAAARWLPPGARRIRACAGRGPPWRLVRGLGAAGDRAAPRRPLGPRRRLRRQRPDRPRPPRYPQGPRPRGARGPVHRRLRQLGGHGRGRPPSPDQCRHEPPALGRGGRRPPHSHNH